MVLFSQSWKLHVNQILVLYGTVCNGIYQSCMSKRLRNRYPDFFFNMAPKLSHCELNVRCSSKFQDFLYNLFKRCTNYAHRTDSIWRIWRFVKTHHLDRSVGKDKSWADKSNHFKRVSYKWRSNGCNVCDSPRTSPTLVVTVFVITFAFTYQPTT